MLKKIILFFLISLLLVCIFFMYGSGGSVLYFLGSSFFGKVNTLYNPNLAYFFFEQASSPFIGQPEENANYQLARIHFIRGEFDEALIRAYKELELYPDNKRVYYILGLTYGYMGHEKKAIEMFETYIQLTPTTWAARNDKAWLQFRVGDIDGALATLEPVKHLTNVIWVQNSYGVMLMNKGRDKEALEALTHAKNIADTFTEEAWGYAYPGNDPRIYATGLKAMKKSIEENIKLLNERENK